MARTTLLPPNKEASVTETTEKTTTTTTTKAEPAATKAERAPRIADIADNSITPSEREMNANTSRETAQVAANQKRYDLRSSGKSSAEVNDMEAKAR